MAGRDQTRRLSGYRPQEGRAGDRPGNDLTYRFPLIVETLARLRSRSCIIDGEAVACDDNGVASFDLVRHHRANDKIFLYAFDLIELNSDDLRREVCYPFGRRDLGQSIVGCSTKGRNPR